MKDHPWLIATLKLVGVPTGLVLLIAQVFNLALESAPAAYQPEILLYGLLVNQIANWFFSLRFRWSMAAAGYGLTRLEAFRVHLESMFYFFVLPMTVGIELSRFAKLFKLDSGFSRYRLTAGLLIDRFTGASAAILVGVMCLPFVGVLPQLSIDAASLGVLIATGLLAVFAVILLLRRYAHLLRSLDIGALSWAGLWSLPTQTLFCLACWLIALSYSTEIGLMEMLFVVSLSNVLIAVPASFAGVSLVEAGAAGLWILLGHTVADAAVLSFLPYALRVVIAVQGAVLEFADGARNIRGSSG